MENVIIIAILVAILGGAVFYVLKAKRKGQACIGCLHAKDCSSHSAGCGCENPKDAV